MLKKDRISMYVCIFISYTYNGLSFKCFHYGSQNPLVNYKDRTYICFNNSTLTKVIKVKKNQTNLLIK